MKTARPDNPPVTVCFSKHMVSGGSCLSLGRSGERKSAFIMAQSVCQFNSISYSIDVRIIGLIIVIYKNTARLPQFNSAVLCELRLRTDTDSHDHGFSRKSLSTRKNDLPFSYLTDRLPQIKLYPIIQEFLMEKLRHLFIQRL